MKTSIYIACHKPYWVSTYSTYKSLHVGAASSTWEGASLRDDTGSNISIKNSNYCELTGLYWVWKNDTTSDIIGLCHYRRYFAFLAGEMQSFPGVRDIIAGYDSQDEINKIVSPVCLEEYLNKHDIIVPIPVKFEVSLEEHYCMAHISDDWNVMKKAVSKLFPEYSSSMKACFAEKWFYPYNMFIMRRALFEEYMSWLFLILDEVERNITIDKDPYQARVFGFLSERLFNLFVYHKHLKKKEIPIVFIDEEKQGITFKRKRLRFMIRDFKNLF
ncbi:DUF4422 domain-containing protein [Anaerospora sp.]|uniref:DUF4422 domain-containing protein n=1 Tax=Anaerospora sp. TaxID=1960278 RepID=UPI00289BC6E1|nr:DUF4422 domain-containing protein [Anaerospora sp.]